MHEKREVRSDKPFATCGENLAEEWAHEERGGQLWDALSLAEKDPTSAISRLSDLASSGSGLSAYYLGDAHLFGRYGIPKDFEKAEFWLEEATLMESIEGCFLLAQFLQGSGRHEKAIKLYKKLMNNEFSPAAYSLGMLYWKGEFVNKDVDLALRYFKIAKKQGHLHAAHWVSFIMRQYSNGIITKLVGLFCLIRITLPFVYFKSFRPHSDKLRT